MKQRAIRILRNYLDAVMEKNMSIKTELENMISDMEKVAEVFNVEPFELYLLGGSACILGEYSERAIKLEQFKYLKIYILSPEDIIVSKIIRLAEKDIEDIDLLILKADMKIIKQVVNEVLARTDLYKSKRDEFLRKLVAFEEKYIVKNCM